MLYVAHAALCVYPTERGGPRATNYSTNFFYRFGYGDDGFNLRGWANRRDEGPFIAPGEGPVDVDITFRAQVSTALLAGEPFAVLDAFRRVGYGVLLSSPADGPTEVYLGKQLPRL